MPTVASLTLDIQDPSLEGLGELQSSFATACLHPSNLPPSETLHFWYLVSPSLPGNRRLHCALRMSPEGQELCHIPSSCLLGLGGTRFTQDRVNQPTCPSQPFLLPFPTAQPTSELTQLIKQEAK